MGWDGNQVGTSHEPALGILGRYLGTVPSRYLGQGWMRRRVNSERGRARERGAAQRTAHSAISGSVGWYSVGRPWLGFDWADRAALGTNTQCRIAPYRFVSLVVTPFGSVRPKWGREKREFVVDDKRHTGGRCAVQPPVLLAWY